MNKMKAVLLTIMVVVLAAGGLAAAFVSQSMNYKNLMDVPGAGIAEAGDNYQQEIGAPTNVVNILFLGIDRTEERDGWLGIYRSDTIAIVRMDLDSKKIKVLNIPRDTYCYLPVRGGYDKINHAYAYGSLEGKAIEATIEAIHAYMGRECIDYYFSLDMEPIPTIVDDLGGVSLDVEIEMKDHGANLDRGLQLLNGQQVFDYIHWRYSPGGDIDRIIRQQKFMRTFFQQQRDKGKLLETLHVVLKNEVNIEKDLTMKQLLGLVYFLKGVPGGSITYYTFLGEGQNINGIDYWIPEDKEGVINQFLGT